MVYAQKERAGLPANYVTSQPAVVVVDKEIDVLSLLLSLCIAMGGATSSSSSIHTPHPFDGADITAHRRHDVCARTTHPHYRTDVCDKLECDCPADRPEGVGYHSRLMTSNPSSHVNVIRQGRGKGPMGTGPPVYSFSANNRHLKIEFPRRRIPSSAWTGVTRDDVYIGDAIRNWHQDYKDPAVSRVPLLFPKKSRSRCVEMKEGLTFTSEQLTLYVDLSDDHSEHHVVPVTRLLYCVFDDKHTDRSHPEFVDYEVGLPISLCALFVERYDGEKSTIQYRGMKGNTYEIRPTELSGHVDDRILNPVVTLENGVVTMKCPGFTHCFFECDI